MKKYFVSILSVLLLTAFTLPGFAAEEKTHQLTGEITKIDMDAKAVTVKGKKGEHTCSIAEETKLMAGDETITLADLKVGNKIICKYTENDNKMVCKSMEVKAPEEKK